MKSKGKLTILVVLFAGVGLLMATTAFDTVEADRTAEVETAGDADALLGLEAGETALAENTNDGLLQITLDDDDDEEDIDGEGLNQDAITSVLPDEGQDGLFTVSNNGADEIEFGIQPFEAADDVSIVFIVNEDAGANNNGTGAGLEEGLGEFELESELIDTGEYDVLTAVLQEGGPSQEREGGFSADFNEVETEHSIPIDSGESIEVGIIFDVGDIGDDGDIFADDTITLTADSR